MSRKLAKIRDSVLPILKKHDVKRAAVFGSYARGEETRSSDVDMMVEFSGKKSLLDLVGLQQDLEETTGVKFDVSTFKAIHPLIKDQVYRERVAILGR